MNKTLATIVAATALIGAASFHKPYDATPRTNNQVVYGGFEHVDGGLLVDVRAPNTSLYFTPTAQTSQVKDAFNLVIESEDHVFLNGKRTSVRNLAAGTTYNVSYNGDKKGVMLTLPPPKMVANVPAYNSQDATIQFNYTK